MKKTILILSGIIITIFSIAQNVWKVPVYNTADKTDIMTLRIKPGMIISLVSVLNKNDSTDHNIKYRGSFAGVTGDSMKIKLGSFTEEKRFTNGSYQQSYIPERICDEKFIR